MNALVMYDRETDSLWSQFLAKGIAGPLQGRELEIIPSQLTNFGTWVKQFPDTMVLDTHTSYPIDDHYLSYYSGFDAGILGEEHEDDRLRRKELVLGVTGEQGQIAYSYLNLLEAEVVNHEFEGSPIVVTVDREGGATAMFRRTVDGEVLDFENVDDMTMTDAATGTIWDKATGRGLSGELKGTQLETFPYIMAFWFAWTDFYPETDLYVPPVMES